MTQSHFLLLQNPVDLFTKFSLQMGDSLDVFRKYFPERTGDFAFIPQGGRYSIQQSGNYLAENCEFNEIQEWSESGSAIYCNYASVFLAVAKCTFIHCANNIMGGAICFISTNGAIYIDQSTASRCFSCNGYNHDDIEPKGQFVYAQATNLNIKSTSILDQLMTRSIMDTIIA